MMRDAPRAKLPRALALSLALFVVAVTVGLLVGTQPISVARAFRELDSQDGRILFGIRLPRVILGAIAGAGLASTGVAFQAVLRNPLAEPYVLGVSGGAAFGATMAIVLGLGGATMLGAPLLPLVALAGGMGATMLVYSLARSSGRSSGASVLLAGVVVNAIASGAITFVKTLVSDHVGQELLFWLVGFLDAAPTSTLVFVGAYVAIGIVMLLWDAGRLNLLALGDESATFLGVDVRALELRVFFACSLVVGAIVSVTGLIGFVGLIVPHALRRIVGPDVRVLLPASVFGGAATLILCDALSRGAFRFLHTQPPVGAVTALVGGPLFLLLLRRRGA
jgi:iron complex transport system permease protein